MVSLDQKVICPETVFAQEVDGEMVLLDMGSEQYYGLDSVGAFMWKSMQEHESLGEVLHALVAYYDVEEERLRQDLLRLVEHLNENGLIRLETV